MADKQILTTVTFEKNCEYEESSVTRELPIPQQTVKVRLEKPINVTKDANGDPVVRDNNEFWYNDEIQFIAHVYQNYTDEDGVQKEHPIQTGRIEFYYLPNGAQSPILINPSTVLQVTCQLNNQGNASVIYQPKTNGEIYAQYIDDNGFYVQESTERLPIVMQTIPVNIEFTKVPPFIANVEDEISIEVHVMDDDNKPLNYGTVTFLHYLAKDDIENPEKRVEKVIGNPVMVVDGYAKINYIPVQTDDDDEPIHLEENGKERYVEYIRAVYNYENDLYGDSWKYYGTKSKWTGIAVCARNSVTIGVKNLSTTGEGGIYELNENGEINLYAVLYDKKGDKINFTEDDDFNLTFYINGTHSHPKYNPTTPNPNNYEQTDENFSYIEYSDIAIADYSNGEFFATINNLLPGYYTITAQTNIQHTNGDILIDYEDGNVENDKYYASVKNSNTLHFVVDNVQENYNINLSCDNTIIKTKEPINNIKGIVNNLSNNALNILNNQTCYFYIPKLHQTYKGKLIKNEDTLIGTPDESISFSISDNYVIYMYIPSGIYTNNTSETTYHTNNETHDILLPYQASNSLIIQVNDLIDLEIAAQYLTNNMAPCSIEYRISSKYVSNQTNIQVYNQSTNQLIDELIIDENNQEITKQIDGLEAGEFDLVVKGRGAKDEIKVEVIGDILSQELESDSIFASPQNKLGIFLSSQNGNFNSIIKENMHALMQEANEPFSREKAKEIDIESIEKTDDNRLYLKVNIDIDKEGEYWICICYDGDNIFQECMCIPEEFSTFLYHPQVKFYPNGKNYKIEIFYNDVMYDNDNVIIAPIHFLNKNSEIISGLLVTNKNGVGEIYNNTKVNEWWDKWDNITIDFDPYNKDIIDILNKNHFFSLIESKYEYIFDYYDTLVNYNNKLNNDDKIFNTYKKCKINLNRP